MPICGARSGCSCKKLPVTMATELECAWLGGYALVRCGVPPRAAQTDMRALDQKDVVRLLRSEVNRAGSQKEWAKENGVTPSSISMVRDDRMDARAPHLPASLVAAIIGSDLYAFIRASFPIVSGGRQFLPKWHVEAMAYELSEVMRGITRRLIITVPPRILKSICASVALPAFALGHDPSRRIICVSYSEGLARKHANDCRALMRSDLYRRIFPAARISPAKDTETEVMTTARGSRLATSVGGTLTGRGGNLLIIDDPLKPQDAHSESARESLKQWYSNTLLSRLDNKVDGSIVVVMQRLHPDDLVGHLLEQGGWTHLNLPAIAEDETIVPLGSGRHYRRRIGDLLHPERESQKALDELKASMGSMEFSAQYQQSPVPLGGNLIKWSWFKAYRDAPAAQHGDKLIISWDTALSSSQLADYSACVVLLVRGQSIFILEVIRARLEYPELKKTVLQHYNRWRLSACSSYCLLIEKKGSGLSLIQDLQRHKIP